MWFLYALLGAFGKSYSVFFRKKIVGSVSGSMYIWVGYSIILTVLTPFMFSQFSSVVDAFRALPLVVLGGAVSYMIATQLNLEALKREDLSYIAPLNAFVPVFTLIIGTVFLGETPPKFGLVGVLVVVIGAYIISIKPEKINWYDPLKRLVMSAGAQLSIGVALCYAINTVLLKTLSNNGYSSFVVLYVTTLAGWVLLLNVPLTRMKELKNIRRDDRNVVIAGGLSSFAGNFFHILAVATTYASYAASVRRLDSVISVLLGWRYLDEKNIVPKFIGSIVIALGSIIMVLS